MADVFLSYKREDAAKARKLVAALRTAGLDVWWDEDIPASAPWETTIEKALKAAKSMIVCWSPDSVESENVRSEARVAREDGRLVQVFLRSCTPPLFFGERQGVDLSSWRGNPADRRIKEIIASVRRVAGIEERKPAGPSEEPGPARTRLFAVAAAILLFVGAGIGWWFLSPAKAEGPTTLAVLPFRALNPADANLVDAIWDDTRGAIGRNPNVRVLGRQAVEALAKRDLGPSDYRKKVGADFLLDGSFQHVGDQVQMKLSLVRTQDGTEVWSDSIGGKLNDVFALQARIASEVEGRIRGRVAPGGGAAVQNIATSGEVYSIYAEARAHERRRNSEDGQAAIALLRKAVALDPNYAPAWAELGIISGFAFSRRPDQTVAEQSAEATSYLNRALQLAPNLARAHAGLAMVQNLPPQLEGELRRAVQLDPNDAEAWTWLGNCLQRQYRLREALAAHSRAAEIEPLWILTIGNKVGDLLLLKDNRAVQSEIDRVRQTGDPILLAKIKAFVAGVERRQGDQIRTLLQLRSDHPEEAAYVDNRIAEGLMSLGFVNESLEAQNLTGESAVQYFGTPPSREAIQRAFARPTDLWMAGEEKAALYGRLLPKAGRLSEYIGYYDAAFPSTDAFIAAYDDRPGLYGLTAPTLAADLRAVGRNEEADRILRHADELAALDLRNGAADSSTRFQLAYLRAAQERDDEAISLLRNSVKDGELPDRIYQATDIADEPCFARLLNRADFQNIRRQIFARIEAERRKVPLNLLAQAYPAKGRAAA